MAHSADSGVKAPGRSRASGRSGPPVLALHLVQRLGMLAVLNIIPLCGGLWLWWQFSYGHAQFRKPMGQEWLWASGIVLIACAVIAATCWLVMPVARWLRDYRSWHFTHRSALLWAVPSVLGWSCWLGLYLCAAVMVVGCLAAIAEALIALVTVLA